MNREACSLPRLWLRRIGLQVVSPLSFVVSKTARGEHAKPESILNVDGRRIDPEISRLGYDRLRKLDQSNVGRTAPVAAVANLGECSQANAGNHRSDFHCVHFAAPTKAAADLRRVRSGVIGYHNAHIPSITRGGSRGLP